MGAGRQEETHTQERGSEGSTRGAVTVLSPIPKGDSSTHQWQIPPRLRGRCSSLEKRVCSETCRAHARGLGGTWLCGNQTLLVGQMDAMKGSGDFVFRILSHTAFYHDIHRPHAAEYISRPVSNPFTIRAKRGFHGGPIFSFSPSYIALKTNEHALEANWKFLIKFD